MPFLQSSGAISINDIKNLFGGPGSPALSNYYRGGAYIPATKTVTTTVTEGQFYNDTSNYYFFCDVEGNWTFAFWNGTRYGNFPFGTSSFTSGIYTYYKGSYVKMTIEYGIRYWFYQIYRQYQSSSTVNINTGIPSSGQISLSQFYGAEKP